MAQVATQEEKPKAKRAKRRGFGEIGKTKSGRYRARYVGPDGADHTPGRTWEKKDGAVAWLDQEEKLVQADRDGIRPWVPPAKRRAADEANKLTVGEWLEKYLAIRSASLRKSSREVYARRVDRRITGVAGPAGKLAAIPLVELSVREVAAWWDALQATWPETKTTNRGAYILLRAACTMAVEREMIPVNPVKVRAASVKPVPKDKTLPTIEELQAIVDELSDQYRLAGVLCLFHGLRVGEMLAVRREDIVITGKGENARAVVQVRANLQRVHDDAGRCVMERQPPKSAAGRRDVPVLKEWVRFIQAHLDAMEDRAPDALVTTTRTGAAVMDTSFRSVFNRARRAAGVRDDLTPHYGRNWLITRLAELGATPKEIGIILGQEDLSVVLHYMKVSPGRPAELMDRVSNAA